MTESLRPVRHHTAVDHCSWCQRANFTVCRRANSTVCQRANSTGSTKENDVPSATSIQPEGSMNSRNSSDLGSSRTSRSTFLQRSWIPTSRSPDVSFAHTSGLTGSPLYLKMLRYHCLNQRVQTEDGHAMMKFDTFSLAPRLEPRSAWM